MLQNTLADCVGPVVQDRVHKVDTGACPFIVSFEKLLERLAVPYTFDRLLGVEIMYSHLDAVERLRNLFDDLREILEDEAARQFRVFLLQLYEIVSHTAAYIHDSNFVLIGCHSFSKTLFHRIKARIHPARPALVVAGHVVVKCFLDMWPLFPPYPRSERSIMAELERTSCVIEGLLVFRFFKESWQFLKDGQRCFGAGGKYEREFQSPQLCNQQHTRIR